MPPCTSFVERLLVLSSGRITDDDVRAAMPAAAAAAVAMPASLDASRADAEKGAIQKALAETKGNRTTAAKLLGVSRRTLHNKLREYGIE
jgi:two-component system response regulator HydG